MEPPARREARIAGSIMVLVVLTAVVAAVSAGLSGTARTIALVGVGFVFAGLALWKLPQWQSEAARRPGAEKTAFELENEARRTLAEALGGLFLVVGLAATWLQLEQGRQEQRDTAARVATEQALTRERSASEQALTREGQITDRFTAAVEQLGSDDRAVRLGGIYALERIAHDSADDVEGVMQVLTAYLRESAPWPVRDETATPPVDVFGQVHPEEDVQAVLAVIERGRWAARIVSEHGTVTLSTGCLDLSGTDLRGARFRGTPLVPVCLAAADLTRADLRGAQLRDADLTLAELTEAHLEGADLTGADLRGADLGRAHLEDADPAAEEPIGADLTGADLSCLTLAFNEYRCTDLGDANLSFTTLTGTDMTSTDLRGATLTGVDLTDANLRGADLAGATLTGAVLAEADLSQAQLNSAFWDVNQPPVLPPGLTFPPVATPPR